MRIKAYICCLGLLLFSGLLMAQPANDDCLSAIQLDQLNSWCSNVSAFNNIGATPSVVAEPFCFPDITSPDVWFYFVATANALNINVRGNIPNNPGGSLTGPQLTVYEGNCLGTLTDLECFSDAFGNNFAETFITGLLPGTIYYIRVSGRAQAQGTFQLCINNFNEPPDPSGDCVTGVILCDKSNFSVDYLLGGGSNPNEILGASCIDPITCGSATETSSAWYKWTCDQSGTLSFSLTPNNPDDDLDFLVYELPNGVDDCSGKIELRCMASGANVNDAPSEWVQCTGATGLQFGDADTGEECGCQDGNNNFVAPINMIAGRSYALIVNNYSNSSAGFSINWGGTGTFLGPEVDFTLTPADNIECDQSVSIANASFFGGGSIIGYSWYFGQGATPQSAITIGPHNVTYSSFGPKFITLTVESDGGCLITKTLPLDVQECCTSTVTLDVTNSTDPICPGDENGTIDISGSGGNPAYVYSINNSQPLPYTSFTNLGDGQYTILMQDIKGCQDDAQVTLNDPLPVIVDAGPDVTINLGDTYNLNAIGSPPQDIISYTWVVDTTTLSCLICTDPTASPARTTQYEVQVLNDVGCISFDRVTIIVREDRPIYIPNVISANDDGNNDRFYIFGNNAAEVISELRIFNRWGALVYEGIDVPLGETPRAWDGSFNGEPVNPGVFAFYARIKFIDDRVLLYEGDITVLR